MGRNNNNWLRDICSSASANKVLSVAPIATTIICFHTRGSNNKSKLFCVAIVQTYIVPGVASITKTAFVLVAKKCSPYFVCHDSLNKSRISNIPRGGHEWTHRYHIIVDLDEKPKCNCQRFCFPSGFIRKTGSPCFSNAAITNTTYNRFCLLQLYTVKQRFTIYCVATLEQ